MSQKIHNPEVKTAVQLSGYPGLVKRDGGWVKITSQQAREHVLSVTRTRPSEEGERK